MFQYNNICEANVKKGNPKTVLPENPEADLPENPNLSPSLDANVSKTPDANLSQNPDADLPKSDEAAKIPEDTDKPREKDDTVDNGDLGKGKRGK